MATGFAAESWTNSISPAVLVDLGLEAFRHARCLAVIRAITSPAWRTSGAAAAGVGAFPWSGDVGFAHPACAVAPRASSGRMFVPDHDNTSTLAIADQRSRSEHTVLKSLSCLRRLARELGWRHPLRRYEQAPIRLISDQM
jgi:hypothetical protein